MDELDDEPVLETLVKKNRCIRWNSHWTRTAVNINYMRSHKRGPQNRQVEKASPSAPNSEPSAEFAHVDDTSVQTFFC